MTRRPRGLQFLLAFMLILAVGAVLGCSSAEPTTSSPTAPDGGGIEPDSPDLEPFRVMARAYAECPPSRSKLWLVDDSYVVWGVETMCPDFGSPLWMFDAVTRAELCKEWIDVAGGGLTCSPAAPAGMFETIRMNRDLPDLGLGPDHTVVEIPF